MSHAKPAATTKKRKAVNEPDLATIMNRVVPKIYVAMKTSQKTTFKKSKKLHKPSSGYESNSSAISGISNNNEVEEYTFAKVKANQKNRFNQLARYYKDKSIATAPRGVYTYVLGEMKDESMIYACRPFSKQELGTLHANIVDMMKLHKELVVFAGELQIIFRKDLSQLEEELHIVVEPHIKQGKPDDKLYLFNFESGTYSAAKVKQFNAKPKNTEMIVAEKADKKAATIAKWIDIYTHMLSSYGIEQKNIYYTANKLLETKRIVTSRSRMGILSEVLNM